MNNAITLLKTDAIHPDFRELVKLLDAHLEDKDGDKHPFFAQFNTLDAIKHAIVAYENDVAVGCGAIKAYSDAVMEVKRMYVKPEYRGQGIASQVLASLEEWAKAMNYSETILETLKAQTSVVAMYLRNGYEIIPNYGQYQGVESSVCMNKKL
ncbi:GNAT family N-acetyltransferase [Runella sp.]|uniref:GNAT family N-acetyltransferase n=1 Tax=Runella sp. TaxID=1960881 RepID=UPI003D12868E